MKEENNYAERTYHNVNLNTIRQHYDSILTGIMIFGQVWLVLAAVLLRFRNLYIFCLLMYAVYMVIGIFIQRKKRVKIAGYIKTIPPRLAKRAQNV